MINQSNTTIEKVISKSTMASTRIATFHIIKWLKISHKIQSRGQINLLKLAATHILFSSKFKLLQLKNSGFNSQAMFKNTNKKYPFLLRSFAPKLYITSWLYYL